MTSLRQNLIKRIERLPKPKNATGALIPLFEAIMNAVHSTQNLYKDKVASLGRVDVFIETDRKKESVQITVEDNGSGLDRANWDAFTTTDTDNKISIGGKGVGRLMWLDCFTNIEITSVFKEDGKAMRRSFRFALSADDQIENEIVEQVDDSIATSFVARFTGLRPNGYLERFPGRGQFIFQHLTSHFLPTFIGGRCPKVTVEVNNEAKHYPHAINEIVHRQTDALKISTEDFGDLWLTLMECDKVASADLKGLHFVHFIAHDRTVESRPIDGMLGLKQFGNNEDRVFHAIVTGTFLDRHVNQERTAFNFEDAVIDRIINENCKEQIEEFLAVPLSKIRGEQRSSIEKIVETYPSIGFDSLENLQNKVPSGELKMDAIYGHLSRERYRRDEKQAEKIRVVLARLKDTSVSANAFAATVADAGKAIEIAEQRSLAEYVVRRKVLLEFLELLIQKVSVDTKDSDYQREDVLHSFICPLKVNAITHGNRVEPTASHDLWIIDERLTFATYFSSDTSFAELSASYDSKDRPDVLVFDHVHGLRQTDGSSKVLLVEFKRPGRKSYADDENPQQQVERYIRQLQSGKLADARGRPITLSKDTVFSCFIIADIVGKLDEWTYSWRKTPDGRGRIYRPDDGFVGTIELVAWDSLLADAKMRNQAFFDKVGISGRSFFSP